MSLTTVYCVADESAMVGQVTYHMSMEEADRRYDRLVNACDNTHSTVTRFDLHLDGSLPLEAVTNEVDAAMWAQAYQPIRRRVGTDGYSIAADAVAALA